MNTFHKLLLRFASQRLTLRTAGFLRSLDFHNINEGRSFSGIIEKLSDEDLHRLNKMLSWKCYTADLHGRRFGNAAWINKRMTPQAVPDNRIVMLDKLFGLKGKSVLEIGCFEGVHTIGLAKFSDQVRAIDSRIENVVKTLVRANLFGFKPDVDLVDVEDEIAFQRLSQVDIVHHVGVLYHLKDPAKHLLALASKARLGLLLDTHYATPEMAKSTMKSGTGTYQYFNYREGGRDEVFSGMYDHAKWLMLDDIKSLLVQGGFTDIRVACDELQRNGPRVTLYAGRSLARSSNAVDAVS